MAELEEKILKYKNYLEKYLDRTGDEAKLVYVLRKLEKTPVSLQHLQDTGVGKTVNSYRKHDGIIGEKSKELVSKWKALVPLEAVDSSSVKCETVEKSTPSIQCETVSETIYSNEIKTEPTRAPYLEEPSSEMRAPYLDGKAKVKVEKYEVSEKRSESPGMTSDIKLEKKIKQERKGHHQSPKKLSETTSKGHTNEKYEVSEKRKSESPGMTSDIKQEKKIKQERESRHHSPAKLSETTSKGHTNKHDLEADRKRHHSKDRKHKSEHGRDSSKNSNKNQTHHKSMERDHSSEPHHRSNGESSFKKDDSYKTKQALSENPKILLDHASRVKKEENSKYSDKRHEQSSADSKSMKSSSSRSSHSHSHKRNDNDKHKSLKSKGPDLSSISQVNLDFKDLPFTEEKPPSIKTYDDDNIEGEDLSELGLDKEAVVSMSDFELDEEQEAGTSVDKDIKRQKERTENDNDGVEENDNGGMSFEDFLKYDLPVVKKKKTSKMKASHEASTKLSSDIGVKVPSRPDHQHSPGGNANVLSNQPHKLSSSGLEKPSSSSRENSTSGKSTSSSSHHKSSPSHEKPSSSNKSSSSGQGKSSSGHHRSSSSHNKASSSHHKSSSSKHKSSSSDHKSSSSHHKSSSSHHKSSSSHHTSKSSFDSHKSSSGHHKSSSGHSKSSSHHKSGISESSNHHKDKSNAETEKNAGDSRKRKTPDTVLMPPPGKQIKLSQEDIMSTLPEITPVYKPLPRLTMPGSPSTSVEDMEVTLSNLKSKSRTAVYSGKKQVTLTAVPRLFAACIRVLIDNVDSLEFVGGVPYEILKPVMEVCTPSQLYTLEDSNPQFVGDTDELWLSHCAKDFRNAKPSEFEGWRELYLRLHDEREAKLAKLTANISASMKAKAAPVKKTKLAYVDSTAKAPRDVRRRQKQFGTAGPKSAMDPLAKLSSHGGKEREPKAPRFRPMAPERERPKKEIKIVAPMMAKTLRFMKKLKRK